jgi:hypothetical protein
MVSTTDEKELALCETCGTVITTRAHLDWLAKKLGPMAFIDPIAWTYLCNRPRSKGASNLTIG